MTANVNGYDSKSETEKKAAGDADFVRMWVDALHAADEEEKDWRKKAEETIEIFRANKKSKGTRFNIFHANIETLCPAIYNSTPVPDVRRRFSDPDATAKVVVDLLERSIAFSLDDYDFDSVMKGVILDGERVGRGIPRVRYLPTIVPQTDADGKAVVDAKGNPIEEVVEELVQADYVAWKWFRRGPGEVWKQVPWVAFGDFLSREELQKIAPKCAADVPLNYTAQKKDNKKAAGEKENSIFKRALVWQIWDKENGKVISICPDYSAQPLAVIDDPLGLIDFFPIPRPYAPIFDTDTLVPLVPYSVYEDLAAELNDVTARISKLVKQVRVRGGYAGRFGDIKAISEADDGELVPLNDLDQIMNTGAGGIEKALTWFPLEPVVGALKVLIEQRNEIKQLIYEVTGIADILRGATDPNETLGAQQMKAQWGSLRIQNRQGEAARVARDVLRLKAEIVATKFSWQTLTQMTGISLPTQKEKEAAAGLVKQAEAQAAQQAAIAQQPQPPGMGAPAPNMPGAAPDMQPPAIDPAVLEQAKATASQPSQEEVMELLRSELQRRYRVDIESDSTIRGDLARNQQIMNAFLTGTAQFAQAMGPILMQFPNLKKAVMEVYAAFARQFKLGKQAEDAISQLLDAAGQEEPQQQPDPKIEQVKQTMVLEKEKHQQDMVFSQQKHEQQMGFAADKAARAALPAPVTGGVPQPGDPVVVPQPGI